MSSSMLVEITNKIFECSLRLLRRYLGKLSHVASLIFQLRPFVAPVWAALSELSVLDVGSFGRSRVCMLSLGLRPFSRFQVHVCKGCIPVTSACVGALIYLDVR